MSAMATPQVEVVLEPLGSGEDTRRVKVSLHDRSRQGLRAEGEADLNLGQVMLRDERGDEWKAEALLKEFLSGDTLGASAGKLLGRLLFNRLFASSPVGNLWRDISSRLGGRRMWVVLVLPRELPWLASLPFELLCDEEGFLFYRGHMLTRTLRGLDGKAVTVRPGMSALVAWANPHEGALDPVPEEDLLRHEQALEAAAREFGWKTLPALRNVTKSSLPESLRKAQPPVQVLSLIAHGDVLGGAVWLCSEQDPGQGELLTAAQFSQLLQGTGVELLFLWSCYGGHRHPVGGSVAEALIHPEYGNLSAILAAPGALKAGGTVPFFQSLLKSLRHEAHGNLEQALAQARREQGEENLQWAAPALYARPLQGRTVEALAETARELLAAATAPVSRVEDADVLTEHFLGRQQKVEELLGLLRGGKRFISIVGLPGIGKTQVAVAAAEAAREDPALGLERALWISLEGMAVAEEVRDRLALKMGLEQCQKDEDLAKAIGSKRFLVVLDNAEDLLREPGTSLRFRKFLDVLLRQCSGLKLLVSSRKPVDPLRGGVEEVVRVLEPLAPEVAKLVFLSWVRARVAEEGLEAGESERFLQQLQNSPDFKALIQVLDGHPLSLVLVAGQILPGMGPRELRALRECIEHDPDAIRDRSLLYEDLDGSQDSDLRLQRLVSSLNLSFLPLRSKEPLAARILTWLGHLPAGLRVGLAPLIFGEGAGVEIDKLRRSYLVRVKEDLISLLVPVQRYALYRLPDTVPTELSKEWMLGSMKAVGGWLRVLNKNLRKQGAGQVMAEASREATNLASLFESVEKEQDAPAELAQYLSAGVSAFAQVLSYQGAIGSRIQLCERAAQWLRGKPGEANTLRALGNLYVRTDRLREAEEAYGKALTLCREIEDRLGEANTLQSLGALCVRTDRLKEAEEVYGKVLPLYREIEERLGEANTLKALGDLRVRKARLGEAGEAYGKALPLYREIEDRLGEANTLHALGNLYVRTARLKEAEEAYGKALPVYREIEARLGEADTLHVLGNLYVRTARLRDAEEAYGKALTLCREIKARLGEANTLRALGDLYMRTDRLREAEDAYGKALPLYREIEVRLGEANTLQALGDLYMRADRLREAEDAYGKALPLYREIEERLGEANTLKELGELYVRTDRLKEAEDAYGKALPLCREIKDRLGEANVYQALGNLELARGNASASFTWYLKALGLHRVVDPSGLSLGADHGYLSRAARAAGNPARAVVLAEMARSFLVQAQDRFGQMLALDELRPALADLKDGQGSIAAALLAWSHAHAIGHSSVEPRARRLSHVLGGFEPDSTPTPQWIAEAEEALSRSVAVCRAQLEEGGEDPYAPL